MSFNQLKQERKAQMEVKSNLFNTDMYGKNLGVKQ